MSIQQGVGGVFYPACVHLIARSLEDLSEVLATISDSDGAFPAQFGRADAPLI